MSKQATWKKMLISSIALAMLASGGTAAFADSNHKDKDRKDGKNGGKGHYEDKNRGDKDDDDDDDDKYKVSWNFKDDQDFKWATEHIMRLSAKGVFTGYEDGTFKPHQKVSRIEALTAAVRLMGLRDKAQSEEAKNTNLHFKDADKIKKKYPWAVGYVAVALENDLFMETDDVVKPEANASRLWSTILLVKALKLEDEAKALNNTKLEFRDANEIPAGAVGYVAIALEKGIISGYKDKHGYTFRPNQPVTRAELAALLDRTDNQLPDQDARAINGYLKAAPANGVITVVQPDKKELTLTLDPNVFIFKDEKKSPVSALKAGDQVFLRTYQQKVVFLEVTKNAPTVNTFAELGVINALSFNSQAKLAAITISRTDQNQVTTTLVYPVDANVSLVGDVSKLKVGQWVLVSGENGIAKKIEIQ